MYSEAWDLVREGRALKRTFHFNSFENAFDFMKDVALYAQKINHHPDWSNFYARVDIVLSTQDMQGLSEKDIDLACHIDLIALNYSQNKP